MSLFFLLEEDPISARWENTKPQKNPNKHSWLLILHERQSKAKQKGKIKQWKILVTHLRVKGVSSLSEQEVTTNKENGDDIHRKTLSREYENSLKKIQMTSQNYKRCLASFIIVKMQVEITTKQHFSNGKKMESLIISMANQEMDSRTMLVQVLIYVILYWFITLYKLYVYNLCTLLTIH